MLKDDIKQYIELKHSLGFKYRVQASLLYNFAAFAERQDDRFVRTETVLIWAAQAPSVAQRRNRLLTIRRFAKVMHVEDSHHQVPPKGAFSHRSFNRRIPHIYSENEISMLLQAAAKLKPEGSIRPATYKTLFGLIVATGLRISEALAFHWMILPTMESSSAQQNFVKAALYQFMGQFDMNSTIIWFSV